MESGVPLAERGFTRLQVQLLEELGSLATELGKVYLGALRVLSDESNPARVYFVAHAVREVANQLPKYLDIPIAKRVEYVNLLDDLAPRWEEATGDAIDHLVLGGVLTQEDEASVDQREVSIPLNLYRAIDELIAKHVESRENRPEVMKRLIKSRGSQVPGASDSYLEPVIKHWIDVIGWFVRRVHLRGPDRPPPDLQECVEKFGIFERALYALLCPFYGAVEELDAILEEANATAS
jgi:hypothetical protein